MNPLSEVRNCRQVRGEPRRRWFGSEQMDLIVWCDDTGAPIGFQLCYDLARQSFSEHSQSLALLSGQVPAEISTFVTERLQLPGIPPPKA